MVGRGSVFNSAERFAKIRPIIATTFNTPALDRASSGDRPALSVKSLSAGSSGSLKIIPYTISNYAYILWGN